MRKLKVLVSAYACEPGKGSEPGVGWNWVQQIARYNEVWVITRKNNRERIEKALAETQVADAHFVYCDLPRWVSFWKKGGRGLHFYYYLWQIRAYFVASALHREMHFDVGHHVTFAIDWCPTFLSLLPIPFVWGPVGGSNHRAPLRFWAEFGWRGLLYEIVRTCAVLFGRYLDPFVWLTRKRAGRIITMSSQAAQGFPHSLGHKVSPLINTNAQTAGGSPASPSRLLHIGFAPEELPATLRSCQEPNRYEDSGELTVFTAGRLVHWKGYSVLLKACSQFRLNGGRITLWIGGSGPEEHRLRKIVSDLNMGAYVSFLGHLPDREALLNCLSKCDVFAMPTFHDGPPVIFLEAMAVGKPVLCLDLGGASETITPECGVKVQPGSVSQIIADLATNLKALADDAALRSRLGAAGRRRILQDFGWDQKGDLLPQIYRQVVKSYS